MIGEHAKTSAGLNDQEIQQWASSGNWIKIVHHFAGKVRIKVRTKGCTRVLTAS